MLSLPMLISNCSSDFIFNFIFIFCARILYILAQKLLILFDKYILNICYLNIECVIECDMSKIKSVKLIKLNKRLQLHHFSKLVGGNKYNNFFVFLDLCFIDKYLYLIFNVF